MLDLSGPTLSTDAGQPFEILRSTGSFVNGVWTESNRVEFLVFGVVSVAKEKDLRMFPEGDRIEAAMVFHTPFPLYITQVSSNFATSDQIVWRGDNYRIMYLAPYEDYGYFRAIATRMTGD